ncbi:hypothetical protein SFUMM280S_05555 [Streptomyces fumanus]
MRWRPAPTPTWGSPAGASGPCGWPRTPSPRPVDWDEPDPDWIRFFSEAELYGENSHSFRDLAYVAGRSPAYASLAEPLMSRAVELFAEDEEHQRSYALNLVGMATVHLLRREPEQSTALVTEALGIARKVRSERVNTRIRKTVDTAVRDFGDLAEVTDLTERLAAELPRDRRGGLDPTDPGRGRPSPNCPTRLPRAKSSEGRRGRSRWLRHDNDRASPIPAVHPRVTRTEPSSRRRNNQGRPPKPRCANLVAHNRPTPHSPPRLRPHGAVPTTRETPDGTSHHPCRRDAHALCRQHRVHAHLFRPGDAHDPRPGLLLRRHGPRQEHPEHADDELHQPRHRHRPVGAVRVLHGVRHGFRLRRRLELRLGGA